MITNNQTKSENRHPPLENEPAQKPLPVIGLARWVADERTREADPDEYCFEWQREDRTFLLDFLNEIFSHGRPEPRSGDEFMGLIWSLQYQCCEEGLWDGKMLTAERLYADFDLASPPPFVGDPSARSGIPNSKANEGN